MAVDDQTTLLGLQQAIEAAGLQTHLAEPSDAVPVPQLLTLLSETLDKAPLRCEILVLPDIPEPPVLQLFVPMPFQVDQARIGDLARLLHMLNNVMPVNGFGLLESAREVYFRLLLPYREGTLDEQLVVETLFMLGTCIAMFGGLTEKLAESRISLQQASEKLQSLLEELEVASL